MIKKTVMNPQEEASSPWFLNDKMGMTISYDSIYCCRAAFLTGNALEYFVISFVIVRVPNAPDPFACTTLSGTLSRLNVAIFSNN
jgi:hypothetical protein